MSELLGPYDLIILLPTFFPCIIKLKVAMLIIKCGLPNAIEFAHPDKKNLDQSDQKTRVTLFTEL